MRSSLLRLMLAAAPLGGALGGCEALAPLLQGQPVETEFSMVNLSRRWYAVIAVRPAGAAAGFVASDLIAPGAVYRERFLTLFPSTGGCPSSMDLRVYLFKRVNEDVPIGLDPGETVDPQPVASTEALGVAACETTVASTFTMVLRDSDEGRGVLQVAQETSAARRIDFEGDTAPPLAELPPHLAHATIAGRVISPNGAPVPGVGVLLRTRFRVNDDDMAICPDEPVGICFSPPIAITITDDGGAFTFDRPPGAYAVEVFGDDLFFRPHMAAVETPIDNLVFIAEPPA